MLLLCSLLNVPWSLLYIVLRENLESQILFLALINPNIIQNMSSIFEKILKLNFFNLIAIDFHLYSFQNLFFSFSQRYLDLKQNSFFFDFFFFNCSIFSCYSACNLVHNHHPLLPLLYYLLKSYFPTLVPMTY